MINPAQLNVKVIHGSNDGVFGLTGASVSSVRCSLADAFNIPPHAVSFVNGEQVADDFVLRNHDTLEFCVICGTKAGRYPGGKAKLTNEIVPRLTRHLTQGVEYREAFFGWGAIGLELIKSNQVTSVWINDIHPGVAAYWTCVIRYPRPLMAAVRKFAPSREAFFDFKKILLVKIQEPLPADRTRLVELALQKLAIHRMSFSGLGEMAGGPLTDIYSRWNPEAHCREISEAHNLLTQVNVHGDCCSCLDFSEMLAGDRHVLYLDPPYFQNGEKCYPAAFSALDHARLADKLRLHRSPWVLSYDDCPEIRSLYRWAVVEELNVRYSIVAATRKRELLITPR